MSKPREIYYSDFQTLLIEAAWLSHGQLRVALRIFAFDKGNFYENRETKELPTFSQISVSQKWLADKCHVSRSTVCEALNTLYPYLQRENPRHRKDVTRLTIWWEAIREDTRAHALSANKLCPLREQTRQIAFADRAQSKDKNLSLPYVGKVKNKSRDATVSEAETIALLLTGDTR